MDKTNPVLLSKPKLRGYFHQEAFFFAAGASVLLVAHAQTRTVQIAFLVYALSLITLFGVSAIYHRFTWTPRARRLLKRLDHAAIFILIAGTMTPLALLAVPPANSLRFLILIWSVAAIGVVQSVVWVQAPKWVSALIYLAAGWMLVPYLGLLSESIGGRGTSLLILGGCLYSLGAIFYALKWPRLSPNIFGYHELFHALTILAAAFHFVVIYGL